MTGFGLGYGIGKVKQWSVLNQVTEIYMSPPTGNSPALVDAFLDSLIVGGVPTYEGTPFSDITVDVLGNAPRTSASDASVAILLAYGNAVNVELNLAPTDITLTGSEVTENVAIGTVIGTLSATDPNAYDTFTFAKVAGTGDTNNASVSVDGTNLVTAAEIDFETTPTLAVRLQVTDANGLTFEKSFEITIINDVSDDGPTYGDELITAAADREFSSDTGWWAKNGTSIGSGLGTWSIGGGSGTYFRRANLLTVGHDYRVVFTMSNYLSSSVRISNGTGTNHTIIGGTTPDDLTYGIFYHNGTIVVEFTAISTTFAFEGFAGGALPCFSIDNVSLKEIL